MKDIQPLIEKIIVLNIFIPRTTKKCRPSYAVVKDNTKELEWNVEQRLALNKIMEYLSLDLLF